LVRTKVTAQEEVVLLEHNIDEENQEVKEHPLIKIICFTRLLLLRDDYA